MGKICYWNRWSGETPNVSTKDFSFTILKLYATYTVYNISKCSINNDIILNDLISSEHKESLLKCSKCILLLAELLRYYFWSNTVRKIRLVSNTLTRQNRNQNNACDKNIFQFSSEIESDTKHWHHDKRRTWNINFYIYKNYLINSNLIHILFPYNDKFENKITTYSNFFPLKNHALNSSEFHSGSHLPRKLILFASMKAL